MRNFLAGGGAPPAAAERGAGEAAAERSHCGFRPPSSSRDRAGTGHRGAGAGGAERPAPYAMGWVKPGPAVPTVMAARGLRPPRRARAGAGAGAAVLLPVLLLVLSRGAAQELSPRGRNVCRAGG